MFKFELGDLVRLKSGGPDMVIVELPDKPEAREYKNGLSFCEGYSCRYFLKGQGVVLECIEECALVLKADRRLQVGDEVIDVKSLELPGCKIMRIKSMQRTCVCEWLEGSVVSSANFDISNLIKKE